MFITYPQENNKVAIIIPTGDVNDVTGRGRHTSSSALALPLKDGGWIIDTPGIRAFGLAHLDKERVATLQEKLGIMPFEEER